MSDEMFNFLLLGSICACCCALCLFYTTEAALIFWSRPAQRSRRQLRATQVSREALAAQGSPSLSVGAEVGGARFLRMEQGHAAIQILGHQIVDMLRAIPVLCRAVLVVESWKLKRTQHRAVEACIDDLPEFVDVLTLGLQAGISFDAALEAYAERFDTVFAQEVRRALQSYQLGMQTRSRALESICERLPDDAVLRLITALNQALVLGSPLLATLGTLGFELRTYRKARLEERIAKTPIKLLLPLGLCVLPAVLILLMGPIMIQVLSGLSV